MLAVEPEHRETARKCANAVGAIPPFFSTAIRSLCAASHVPEGDCRNEATRELLRRSPTLKAALYLAAHRFHGRAVPSDGELTLDGLLKLFSPAELASIIALRFLTRRISKQCDAAEWNILWERLLLHLDMGAMAGETVDHVGRGYGILIGGIRYASLAIFACFDVPNFQKYRRECAQGKNLFDLGREIKRWGTHHLLIASSLAQLMGFDQMVGLGLGLYGCKIPEFDGPDAQKLTEQLTCWHEAIRLAEALHNTGTTGTGSEESDAMFLPPDVVESLEAKVRVVMGRPPIHDWLTKGRDDISAQVREKLGIRDTKRSSRVSGSSDSEEEADEA